MEQPASALIHGAGNHGQAVEEWGLAATGSERTPLTSRTGTTQPDGTRGVDTCGSYPSPELTLLAPTWHTSVVCRSALLHL
jgi:hypothetical protein